MKIAERFRKKEVRQILFAVLAAFLCFVGPTYFVAATGRFIPQGYAMAIGFGLFLTGIVFVFKLVKE